MAKSTKSRGKGARAGGKGSSGGRAAGTAAKASPESGDKPTRTRPALTAKEAAARAVSKPPTKKQAPAPAASTKSSGPRPRPQPTKRTTPSPSARYTPPIPKSEKVSPLWVPIVMFSCLGLGMATIILNYVNVLPGPDPSNVYLMIGLALITVGFITATKYH